MKHHDIIAHSVMRRYHLQEWLTIAWVRCGYWRPGWEEEIEQ